MKKIRIYTLQNVKNTLLAFGNNIEIFQFPVRPLSSLAPTILEINNGKRRGTPEHDPFSQQIISNGAMEQKVPIPIVNALSMELFKEITNDIQGLSPGSHYEDEIALSIIRNTYISLGIDFEMAFLGGDYKSWKMSLKRKDVSLLKEIIGIVDYASFLAPGSPQINKEFDELKAIYDHAYAKYYDDSYSFNWNALCYRLSNATLIPAYAVLIENAVDKKWFNKEKMKAIDAAYTSNPLGYAWLELHFSEKKNVKFGICSICGGIFSLIGTRGNVSKKAVCGKEECKKALRRKNDEKNKSIDPEKIRKQNLLRKHKSLAYQEIVVQQTTDELTFATKHGYPTSVVEQWITERKIKEVQKVKKVKRKK